MGYMTDNMNTINVCPQGIHSYQCDPDLLKEIVSHIEKEPCYDNRVNETTKDTFLHRREEYQSLVNWFNQCLAHTKQELKHDFIGDYIITQCWGNKVNNGQSHHGHFHSNSLISAIFYLTDSSATTYFKMSSMWNIQTCLNLSKQGYRSETIGEVNATAGKLLLFPSKLFHGVNPSDDDHPRYTMAFNTWIKGVIGNEKDLDLLELDMVAPPDNRQRPNDIIHYELDRMAKELLMHGHDG